MCQQLPCLFDTPDAPVEPAAEPPVAESDYVAVRKLCTVDGIPLQELKTSRQAAENVRLADLENKGYKAVTVDNSDGYSGLRCAILLAAHHASQNATARQNLMSSVNGIQPLIKAIGESQRLHTGLDIDGKFADPKLEASMGEFEKLFQSVWLKYQNQPISKALLRYSDRCKPPSM